MNSFEKKQVQDIAFFLIHPGHNKWIRFHSLGTADYIIALGISPSMESAQKMNTLALSGD